MIILFLIAILFHGSNTSNIDKDEVLILPGLRIQPTFKHYSGYLNGSDTRRLHYWLVESARNASIDPLVLWLNGGPGCSSLLGLITENGPFTLRNGGFLEYNSYSWNKIANVIYLESPSCVGFSYSIDGKCDATDDSTALLNYNALRHFFIKFPKYKNRDFYITGESYGGFYVPMLAAKILLSKDVSYIRLKGVAIGNGYSSSSINHNGNLHFAYNHGLISDRLWSSIIYTCCDNKDPLHCDIAASKKLSCTKMIQQARDQYSNLNPYNIYQECANTSNVANIIWKHLNVSSNYDRLGIITGWLSNDYDRSLKLRKDFIDLQRASSPSNRDQVSVPLPCISDTTTANYLNRKRVRYALHIPTNIPPWGVCSSTVSYKTLYKDMDSQYNYLFKIKNLRIWLYNGDVDMVCSYLSDEWYFERFNRTILQKRKPWTFTDETNSTQIGGFVKKWDRFSLITVRGSGHMVPTDKPIPAFHLFDSFLKGKDL